MPHLPIVKIIQKHGLSILCGTFILILCTIKVPQDNDLPVFPYFDKFVHFTMYFALTAIYLFEKRKTENKTWRNTFINFRTALLVSAVLGGAIEFIQSDLTDYRTGDINDWFADVVGSLAACFLIGLVRLAFRSHGR